MSEIFGESWDVNTPLIRCSTPVDANASHNQLSDNQTNLSFSILSNSMATSEISPSKERDSEIHSDNEADFQGLTHNNEALVYTTMRDGPDKHTITTKWYGYKLIGDNIDKNVKPRNMTSDNQTVSLHYFHSYSVLDRVNLHHKSSIASTINIERLITNAFFHHLPTLVH